MHCCHYDGVAVEVFKAIPKKIGKPNRAALACTGLGDVVMLTSGICCVPNRSCNWHPFDIWSIILPLSKKIKRFFLTYSGLTMQHPLLNDISWYVTTPSI
jgi:hypothetical protein